MIHAGPDHIIERSASGAITREVTQTEVLRLADDRGSVSVLCVVTTGCWSTTKGYEVRYRHTDAPIGFTRARLYETQEIAEREARDIFAHMIAPV